MLTPAVYAAAKAAKAEPLPYLFICALVANAASFVLPISNPANLVVFAEHMPPLKRWLARFALPSILSVATTFAVLRLTQRSRLRGGIETVMEAGSLSKGGKAAALGIVLTGVALIASSALDLQLGLPTFVAGLATVLAVLAIKREGPWATVKEMSWAVIPLVAGLFVLVEALEATGVLKPLATTLKDAAARSDVGAGALRGIFVAFGSNLVNNLPAGLLAGAAVQSAHVSARSTPLSDPLEKAKRADATIDQATGDRSLGQAPETPERASRGTPRRASAFRAAPG